jgi:hypothetical protein
MCALPAPNCSATDSVYYRGNPLLLPSVTTTPAPRLLRDNILGQAARLIEEISIRQKAT